MAKFKKSWSKKQGKAKGMGKVVSAAMPKPGLDSKIVCLHCKETGHWKRKCSKWLAEHGKKAGNASSGKGTLVTYVIDIYLAAYLVALVCLIIDRLFKFATRCRGW